MPKPHAWDDFTHAPNAMLVHDAEYTQLIAVPRGRLFVTESGERMRLVDKQGGRALCVAVPTHPGWCVEELPIGDDVFVDDRLPLEKEEDW